MPVDKIEPNLGTSTGSVKISIRKKPRFLLLNQRPPHTLPWFRNNYNGIYNLLMAMHAFTFTPAVSPFRISGPDREDFIQRQTTNDISGLAGERAVTTVLTSAAARILDVLQLYAFDHETFGLIPLPGQGEATVRYLRGRIFFNDRVALEPAAGALQVLEVLGKQAARALESLHLPVPGPGQALRGSLGGGRADVLRPEEAMNEFFRLVIPAENFEAMRSAFDAAGALRLSPSDYAIRRVEAGLPAAGAELTEDYTPLEVGLAALISETKGCYTGQEVIARQITYDKVTKSMVGLALDQPTSAGAAVFGDGKQIGRVTSAVISPALGPIALAVLRKPFNQPNRDVMVQEANPARTSQLPFPK